MILDEIVAHKRVEVADRQAHTPLATLRHEVVGVPPTRDFAAALAEPGVSLIAEIKKASPSKGVLRADFDPLALAEVYTANGARALSILTDERFFQGSLDTLRAVRLAQAEGRLREIPLLRKDFLIQPYQVWEARVYGADAVLLIVAILDQVELTDMLNLAGGLGMTALVEVHDAAEMERAVTAGAKVVGVNNRDLRTFTVDVDLSLRLRPLAPPGTIFVAESGIHTAADVAHLAAGGVDAVLVGEALVTATDIGARVRELAGT